MAIDLAAISAWGTAMLITLIEDHEFDLLSVRGLGEAVKARGIEWLHFPIRDLDVPGPETDPDWRRISARIHDRVERGSKVLIHCRGGLGRAGTIAACLLIERGETATGAIGIVRSARPGAIETQAQEDWLHAQDMMAGAKVMQACLLGGAMGDSLGADIEFQSLASIQRRFPAGLHDLPSYAGQRGAITDDTQMTLFTAEGMIRAQIRGQLRGICHPPSVVHHALVRWYRTQGAQPRMETDDIGLIEDRRLWRQCAPGMTCMSALGAARHFGDLARNGSKGCGTIMRVAPIALMASRGQVRPWAIETSALTHGHITGQLAAAAWAEMLADVAAGEALEATARRIATVYAQLEGGEETSRAIHAALAAPRDGRSETVESLGGGWTADEALSIALYACLAGEDLDDSLRIAVTHGGDSDSTGAIAGNMLGVMDLDAVLSHPWASTIQGADVIRRLAQDHARLAQDPLAAEMLSEFYPGG
ncbi:ADP-ribosylglycohydrolase family protein [Fuscovulum blasticum]|uniref:ADP-ribosylglycohydrolase family protein n=1 Tax=Fuscovulum blasticum TaxID=1075 RepID=UPI001D178164|nr:ADP-ribosylglycohydrolase family protein [Fuscovulum blasticum]